MLSSKAWQTRFTWCFLRASISTSFSNRFEQCLSEVWLQIKGHLALPSKPQTDICLPESMLSLSGSMTSDIKWCEELCFASGIFNQQYVRSNMIKSTVCSRGRLFMAIGCIKELFFAVQKNELHQHLGEHPSKTFKSFNHQKAQNLTLYSPSSLETYMARLKSEIRSFFGHQLAMVPAVQEVNSSPFRTSKLHRREIFQALRL